ncbi:hypothetical protein AMTRI_Chr09g18100 [Amborella trichopoda]
MHNHESIPTFLSHSTPPHPSALTFSLSHHSEPRCLHAQLLIHGLQFCLPLVTTLLRSYALTGQTTIARLLFDRTHPLEPQRPFLWNTMFHAYIMHHKHTQALSLYNNMLSSKAKPDEFTFSTILKSCPFLNGIGSQIHGHSIVTGRAIHAFVETALIDMYANIGDTDQALLVFDRSAKRDVVTWNSIISGLTLNKNGRTSLSIVSQMAKQARVRPNRITLINALSACGQLRASRNGKEAHAYALRQGLGSGSIMVANSIMDMYCKCTCLSFAKRVFCSMSKSDCASWNVMISGSYNNGHEIEAMMLFREMQLRGMGLSLVTLLIVIPVCATLRALQEGKEIHCFLVKNWLWSDVRVKTALVDMYAKCSFVNYSRKVFGCLKRKDAISWNAMITGYALNSLWTDVLELSWQAQQTCLKPDSVIVNCLLTASTSLRVLHYGKSIHAYMIRNDIERESYLLHTLVVFYAKCGRIVEACATLLIHAQTDAIPWNAMFDIYNESGHAMEALNLFQKMRTRHTEPNSVTLLCLLSTCTHLTSSKKGEAIHGYIVKHGFHFDDAICTSLVKMYGKCGDIESARSIFNNMVRRDTVSWSTVMAAHGDHGLGLTALQLFTQMKSENVKIDSAAFTGILSACTHCGLVEEGKKCFQSMLKDFSLEPELEHYACMVDLLGRAGHLEEAEEFIRKMPIVPDAGVWRPLLGACKIHGHVQMGERVFEQLSTLEPDNIGNYVSLSNIYAEAARWDGVAKVRALLVSRRLKKNPGWSYIEHYT